MRYIHTVTLIHTQEFTHAHSHTCTHIHTHTHLNTHAHPSIHIYSCTLMHMHNYAHTCIHTHIFTHSCQLGCSFRPQATALHGSKQVRPHSHRGSTLYPEQVCCTPGCVWHWDQRSNRVCGQMKAKKGCRRKALIRNERRGAPTSSDECRIGHRTCYIKGLS